MSLGVLCICQHSLLHAYFSYYLDIENCRRRREGLHVAFYLVMADTESQSKVLHACTIVHIHICSFSNMHVYFSVFSD